MRTPLQFWQVVPAKVNPLISMGFWQSPFGSLGKFL
jgi:hypothetical protein